MKCADLTLMKTCERAVLATPDFTYSVGGQGEPAPRLDLDVTLGVQTTRRGRSWLLPNERGPPGTGGNHPGPPEVDNIGLKFGGGCTVAAQADWLEKDLYAVLGVAADSDDKTIRRAYLKTGPGAAPGHPPRRL